MRVGFLDISWIDVLDVALVAYLLYQVFFLIRDSIAAKVFLGYLLIYVAYLIVKALGMELLSTILGQFMNVGVLALLIIFQPEIRRFLMIVGRTTNFQENRFLRRFFPQTSYFEKADVIHEIVESARMMATAHTGALIVIQREDDLKRYCDTGDEIDGVVSKRMLWNIFFKNSPLHDGATIIQNGRIKAARCTLPSSENESISPTLGFRHRAALGMSENSDAAIIVVSEEKGEISLVNDGGMFRSITPEELEKKLLAYLQK
jgi:diadenylate cyclase